MHFTRLDLTAIDIMRGRDNGLADYNSVRLQYGLAARDWHQINTIKYALQPQLFESLKALYGNVSRLDVFVGGMLESEDDGPGELFTAIICDQFTHCAHS